MTTDVAPTGHVRVSPDKILRWHTPFRAVVLACLAIGVVSGVVRLIGGLGGSSNLSDKFPWGLWIGFKLSMVALSAGGFIVAATVYVFHVERYRRVLRLAVLTSFLGYISFNLALLCDLGRPWAIWHIMVMWNPHSVLFEVGWCVMLYTTVLALELAPIICERFRLHKIGHLVHRMTLPLVITGVILSTLHQSSLGSLFLIVPTKMSLLWYSSNLPYLFFTSAVAVGPAVLVLQAHLLRRTMDIDIPMSLLSQMARMSAVALSIHLVLRISDVVRNQVWRLWAVPTVETALYFAEIVIGVLLPILLFAIPKVREDRRRLLLPALLVITGAVLNRFNIAITSLWRSSGSNYYPSLVEMGILLGILGFCLGAFRLALAYLPMFSHEHESNTQAAAGRVAA